jgi:hypothetical protein
MIGIMNFGSILHDTLDSHTSIGKGKGGNEFGVTVFGEEQTFNYNGLKIRAIVNHLAFRNSLESIAQYKGGWDKVQNFIDNNQINISLHRKVPKNVEAAYVNNSPLIRPRLIFPKDFIHSYAKGVLTNNSEIIVENDITIAHELTHLWQDATNSCASTADKALEDTLLGAGAGLGLSVGLDLFIKGEKTDTKEALIRIAPPAATGLTIGFVSSRKINTNFSEKQARSLEDEIGNLPGIKRYQGRFFYFEPAS